MKRFVVLFSFVLVLTNTYGQDSCFSQVDSLHVADAYGITFDPQGNYYVTGDADDTLTYNQDTVNTAYDGVYVAKFNPGHQLLWMAKPSAYSYDNSSRAITLDNNDNPVIGGWYYEPIVFGDDTLSTQNGSSHNPFVAKFSTEGDPIWAVRIHSPGLSSGGQVTSLAADGNGSIYFAGQYSGTLAVGGDTIQSVGYSDLFWGKLDSQGDLQWIKAAGSDLIDNGTSIAVGSTGNFYVAGYVTSVSQANTAYFDTTSIAIDDDGYGFMAKYSPMGQLLWLRDAQQGDFWTGTRVTEHRIKVQDDGSAFLLGSAFPADHTFTLAGLTLNIQNNPEDNAMIFALKIDAQGNGLWIKQIFNVGSYPLSIALAQDNEVLLSARPGSGYLTGPYNETWVKPMIEGDTIHEHVPFVVRLNVQTGNILGYCHPSDDFILTSLANYQNKVFATGFRGLPKTALIANIDPEALSVTKIHKKPVTIKIYPNPTKGRFTVEWPKPNITRFRVYDINGRLVLSKHIAMVQKEIRVNMQETISGIYFLKMETKQGDYITRKIVLK